MLPPDPKSRHGTAGGESFPTNGANHADPHPEHHSGTAHAVIDPVGVAPPPAALSSAPTMSTLLHAFRRAWKVGLPLAILGALGVAAAAWVFVPPQYTSAMVLRINSRPNVASLEEEGNFANVQKSQLALLKSFDVVTEAIGKSRAEELHGVTFSPLKVQKQLITNFNDGPEILNVALSGDNAEATAALLNALGQVYPAKVQAADEARMKNRIVQLRRRLQSDGRKDTPGPATLAEQLRDKRVELAKAEKDAGLDDAKSIVAQFNHAQAMLQTAQTAMRDRKLARTGAEAELMAKQAKLDRPIEVTVPEAEAEELAQKDPDYQELQKNISAKRKLIEQLQSSVSRAAMASQLRKPQAELRELLDERRQLLDSAKRRLGGLKRAAARQQLDREISDTADKVEQAKRQENDLGEEVRKWSVAVENYRAGGPKAPPEVEALRDQVGQLEKEYKRVGDELANCEGAMPLSPRVTLHTEAFVPTEKDYGRPMKFALAGGVLTFCFLLLGVCLMETRGRRVYASEDIMQGLGMRVLGVLPRMPAAMRKKNAQGQLLSTAEQSGMGEAIDAIRTVLLQAPRIDGARVVMVTSAAGGEGKTTLASHLAASLANAWRKTLLIDGDLRNPHQHAQFDQPLEPGLCEALRGEVEFDDIVRPTQIGRLWVMPAGKLDAHALQALAQEGVTSVFDRLKEQYDFIVLDTSPVLPVPDALLLGKQADAVLMAVMKDHTRMPAVYQAQQRLETLGIRVLGAVVIGEKTESYGHRVPYPRPKA